MKKMLHLLFCGCCAALLLATVIVWIRSHFVNDEYTAEIEFQNNGALEARSRVISTESGRITFALVEGRWPGSGHEWSSWPEYKDARWEKNHKKSPADPTHLDLLSQFSSWGQFLYRAGFAYVQIPGREFALILPFWFIAAVLSILTLLSLRLLIREARRKRFLALHICTNCSYDLRSHQPGDKCPECDTVVPPAPVRS